MPQSSEKFFLIIYPTYMQKVFLVKQYLKKLEKPTGWPIFTFKSNWFKNGAQLCVLWFERKKTFNLPCWTITLSNYANLNCAS